MVSYVVKYAFQTDEKLRRRAFFMCCLRYEYIPFLLLSRRIDYELYSSKFTPDFLHPIR